MHGIKKSNFNIVFSNNKTSGILNATGVTTKNKLVEVQRSELVAEHIGGTGLKTMAAINKARGGVLFIDEAYRLSAVGGKDYGREAIETLMSQMTDNSCPVMIFAGFHTEMLQFLNVNSGLARRLKHHFSFDDFSAIELTEITMKKLNAEVKRYPSNADGQIVTCFSKLATDVTKSHNAALCVDFLDLVQTGQEMRLWGNFDNCEKKDLRKYAESDLAYGISKFEERFFVHQEPKTKDVEVMAEYEIVVLEVVMTIPGNAQPVF